MLILKYSEIIVNCVIKIEHQILQNLIEEFLRDPILIQSVKTSEIIKAIIYKICLIKYIIAR